MDLSTVVKAEQTYTLEIKHPVTFEPIGTKFFIRYAESDVAQQKQAELMNESLIQRANGKPVRAEHLFEAEKQKAAVYIAGWDWGDNTLGGEKPEYSYQKAKEIVSDYPWIFAQVVEAANRIGNFTEN